LSKLNKIRKLIKKYHPEKINIKIKWEDFVKYQKLIINMLNKV